MLYALAAALAFAASACKQPTEAEPASEKKEPGVDVSLSPRALAGAKLSTGRPQRVPRRSSLTVAGLVDFVPSHVARIGPQISGRVASVPVTPGQTVNRGAVVVTLDSVDIGRARADFLQAKSQVLLAESELARENRLIDAGASSERAQQTARTSLELAYLGSVYGPRRFRFFFGVADRGQSARGEGAPRATRGTDRYLGGRR
jgi:multidrug efflux pump subunit AcrA (membrane-fusion protein)